jgi:Flp pilus assembly protein TadB
MQSSKKFRNDALEGGVRRINGKFPQTKTFKDSQDHSHHSPPPVILVVILVFLTVLTILILMVPLLAVAVLILIITNIYMYSRNLFYK